MMKINGAPNFGASVYKKLKKLGQSNNQMYPISKANAECTYDMNYILSVDEKFYRHSATMRGKRR